MKKLNISVIIPAHNEENVIARAINSVLANDYKNFEIVVVNDGSTDKTKDIVKDYVGRYKNTIRLINFKKGHSAAFARNAGAHKAKGNILMFLDADSYIKKDFIKKIIKGFSKGADAVAAPSLPLSINFLTWVLSSLVRPYKSYYKIANEKKMFFMDYKGKVIPLFFILKKTIFEKLGGYDENIFYFEDEDFVRRFFEKGYKLMWIPRAIQYFELPSTFPEFIRQCKWIGKGIGTIKDKKERMKTKFVWLIKSILLISPLFFLVLGIKYFLYSFLFVLIIIYLGLILRNKNLLKSLFAIPLVYIKTFLVIIYIRKIFK